MTIQDLVSISPPYAGNGSSTVFTYSHPFDLNSDLVVIYRDSSGGETTKTLGSDYTVFGAGTQNGGYIITTTPPPVGVTIFIRRKVDLTQDRAYPENDPFPSKEHENALDKLTMICQQISFDVGRAIKISQTNTIGSSEFSIGPADRAGKLLSFDSAGEISITQSIGSYRGNWAPSLVYKERDIVKDTTNNNIYICITSHTSAGSLPISSNAGALNWALIVDAASATASQNAAAASASSAATSATAAASSASIATSAQNAAATSAVSAISSASSAATSAAAAASSASSASTSLSNFRGQYVGPSATPPTLDGNGNPLTAGDMYFNTTTNQMFVWSGSSWIASSSYVNGTTNRNTFIAAAGQTVFSIPGGYDAGYIDVYKNGLKLVNGNQVLVTSETDIVLTTPAAGGDTIDTIAYGIFDVANIAASAITSGTLPVARGGTGASTLASNSVLIGNGSSPISSVAPGASGNILTSNGSVWGSSPPIMHKAVSRIVVTTSGFFEKPTGYSNSAVVYIQMWGGGGAGSRSSPGAAGGGGGAYNEAWIPYTSLDPFSYISVGQGGVGTSGSGNNGGASVVTTSTGIMYAYGGRGGAVNAGGGGGGQLTAPSSLSGGQPYFTVVPYASKGLGSLNLSVINQGDTSYLFFFDGNYIATTPPATVWHGAGGGASYTLPPSATNYQQGLLGGNSIYGGSGGGAAMNLGGSYIIFQSGGNSLVGGNGGVGSNTGNGGAGNIRGGGGGGTTAAGFLGGDGGRGEVVLTFFDGV